MSSFSTKISTKPLSEAKADALVLILICGQAPDRPADEVIDAHVGPYASAVEKGEAAGDWFCTLPEGAAATGHLLLESTTFGGWLPGNESLKAAAARAVRRCRRDSLAHLAVALPETDAAAAAMAILEGLVIGDFVDTRFKSESAKRPKLRVDFHAVPGTEKAVRAAVNIASAVLDGVTLARELTNAPHNILMPSELAKAARGIAKQSDSMTCEVWDEKRIQKENCGLLWNVGRGSEYPPRMIFLRYKPKKPRVKQHIVLVGKGMTFDSGGYSLKTRDSIYKMNVDMAGAAGVLGCMQAIAALKLPVRVTAIVPSAHNAIDAAAYQPGCIIKSRSGKTVFVGNTDAEGRLILGDALELAGEMKPDVVVDFATLTGAAIAALGPAMASLYTDDDELAGQLSAAGDASGDNMWRMPLWKEYDPSLVHELADLINMSSLGPRGGAIHAANFLKAFAPKDAKWAHIDMASRTEGEFRYFGKGGQGYGVRLVLRWLHDLLDQG